MTGPDAPFLRTLCSLRWLAVGGQAATILVATWVLGLPLPQLPLWAGVAVLALFNIYTQLRPDAADTAPLTAFGHILVDVIILTWMVGWSGGMANPFSSLFLILIALAGTWAQAAIIHTADRSEPEADHNRRRAALAVTVRRAFCRSS